MKTTTRNCSIIILLLSIFLLLFVGCAPKIPNPEAAVREFWSAFKEGDYKRAAGYLAGDLSTEMIQAKLWPEASEEITADELSKVFLERIDLVIKGHEIKNDTAIVQVEVNWPNMELLLGKFMAEAMAAAFPAALAGVPQEEIDLMLKPIFLKILEDTPDIKTPHDIQLKLINGSWKLTTPPIPDPAEVFNLPNLGKEEPAEATAEVKITEYSMGQVITVDAAKLPLLAGEPELTGTLTITFLSTEKSPSVKDPLYGVVDAEGIFFTVYYSVSNAANSRVQPSTQLNDLFFLMDSEGRRWEPAGYLSHGFDMAEAFALKEGHSDPKAWISPGFTRTTAINYDIPDWAEGLSLRSDRLGISVKLKD